MIRIFEAFAGYGTATFALKQLNIEHELVGFSEIDKYAVKCFTQNHCKTGFITPEGFEIIEPQNYGDITKINWSEVPDFDLLTGGHPCQSFSLAGKRKGIEDLRGQLVFDLIKALEAKRPKYFMFENVKGYLSASNGNVFELVMEEISKLGYMVDFKVLNTREHGIPQNRQRVFYIGVREDVYKEIYL
jgi:DNA (cytosine-5)-methyltransferase 1